MKRSLLVSTLLAAALACLAGRALPEERPNALRDFMRAKLAYSQKVLQGLVTEDFDMIAQNSQAMSLLSRDSNWQVLQTEEYLQQSRDFRRSVDALTAAAKKKNLDAAALDYVDLTTKCVNCHKYVRDVGKGGR